VEESEAGKDFVAFGSKKPDAKGVEAVAGVVE
jgi:hypothetical protein